MFNLIKKLFNVRPKRTKLCCVPYECANEYLKDGWRLAPEEDNNKVFGMVFLEK